MEKLILSSYQEDILSHVKQRKSSLLIQACAGAAKTSTLVMAAQDISTKGSCFLAFNRHIAADLKGKLPTGFETRTLNSMGSKLWWCKGRKDSTLNAEKTQEIFEDWVKTANLKNIAHKSRKIITSLVRMAKTNGIVPAEKENDLFHLNKDVKETWKCIWDNYGFEVDATLIEAKLKAEDKKFDLELALKGKTFQEYCVQCAREILDLSVSNTDIIDFDDQFYLPVINNLWLPMYETMMVDECQDVSIIQMELIRRLAKRNNAMMIGVGDFCQSIYNWRGADSYAMGKFKQMFKCEEKQLPICYRCPKDVAIMARKYNSNILPYEKNAQGVVKYKGEAYSIDGFTEDDMVLSRLNAPLLSIALDMLNTNRPFQYLGRDLRGELSVLINESGMPTIEKFQRWLFPWYEKLSSKLEERCDSKNLQLLNDRVSCLKEICSQLDPQQGVGSISQKIDKVFSGRSGPTLTTVHGAKGLEKDNIHFLDFDTLPRKGLSGWQLTEEYNILYVGVTRAKKTLSFIHTGPTFRKDFYKGLDTSRGIPNFFDERGLMREAEYKRLALGTCMEVKP